MLRIKKTVTIELIRHGPAHNQLLSPLTKYLGICGNFGAAQVSIPYEQWQFQSRLYVLRYSESQNGDLKYRQDIIFEIAREMTGILESLKGLISELGTADGDPCSVVHLNMVISAAELAMLPFELANVPPGCAGGEGSPLLLQNRLRVSMTRQVRNVTNLHSQWPTKPNILFIVASPGNLSVPYRAHTRELFKAINPWVSTPNNADSKVKIEQRKKFLTVITNATREKIEQETRTQQFTHVHILAHGMATSDDPGSPYGLALHEEDNENSIDVVDGQTLVSLLGPLDKNCNQLPSIVTVASCDSGGTRSVISTNGSSLAHDLHRAGVPFVVASQFPLSKKASRHLPGVLYPALLWGIDPRIAVAQLREKLNVDCPETHDWASVVCYASLPDDIEQQLLKLRHAQSKGAIDAAMDTIDKKIKQLEESDVLLEDIETHNTEAIFESLFKRVDIADAHMPTEEGYQTEGAGMKASTHKRRAEAYFKIALLEQKSDQISKMNESLVQLKLSKECYRKSYQTNFRESKEAMIRRSVHWTLCQYLSICAILGENFYSFEWGAAKISCDIDLEQGSAEAIAWANGTLAELNLLLLAYPKQPGLYDYQVSKKKVIEHVRVLIEKVKPDDFAIASTLRQFRRYTNWWGHPEFRSLIESPNKYRNWSAKNGVVSVAREAATLLEVAQQS